MTINELSEMRKNGLRALIENGWFEGFKRLLTDLYPDNAHFIYELLQNAEDAGASKVHFVLNTDGLEFEHNGDKLFEIEDVESITNIGSSTKTDYPTNIGKFGIGFKAVFAYTNTPEIESGKFHFRIRDMVVPDTEGLSPGALGTQRTHFVFPFDNPEKSPEKAAAEIEKNLRKLNENTLLFLNNIHQIKYNLPDSKNGYLERRKNADDRNRIEISVKHPEDILPKSTHYLRFTKDVDVQDENNKPKCCQIAIAFGMDTSKSGKWKIIPLNPGQVCIYFPAVKEPCNLRFHIHAPFASTVARDSVRECPANDELRDRIADLVAESMRAIRDQGLLNVRFLATLPNCKDNLSLFCDPIRERLIEEFNQTKLTPMKQGGHAPASGCYQGRRDLSDLINDEDLATLLGKCCSQPLWIANPQQRNQQDDNFLSMLDISTWTIKNFVEVLETFEDITKWLNKKSNAWHQKLYAFLGDFLSSAQSNSDSAFQEYKDQLSSLCLVRCNDKSYRIGNKCRFSNDDMESDPPKDETQENSFHFVAKGVYSYGKNKSQQKKARMFLEEIDVLEWDIVAEVLEYILPEYRNSTRAIPRAEFNRDFTKIVKAYRTDDSESKKQQLREALMTTPFILRKDSHANNSIYLKPDQLHFGVGDILWSENSIGIYSSVSVTKKVRQFLQKLDIPQWDIVDEVVKTTLPKYSQNPSAVSINEHMVDIEKIAKAYRTSGRSRKMALQIGLEATRFILTEGTRDHNPEYYKPKELYFPIGKLRLYFAGDSTYKFVSSEYHDKHIEMFRELRISDTIRITCKSKPGTTDDIRLPKHGRYYRRGLKGFDPDIQVDGLKHALMNPSVEKSKIIWEHIVIPYSHCIKGKILRSSRQNFSVHAKMLKENEETSDFGHLLRENAWLPDSDGSMHKPSELTLKELPEEFFPDERLADQLGMQKNAVAELAEEAGISVEIIETIRKNPEECAEFFKELQAKKVLSTPHTPSGPSVSAPSSGGSSQGETSHEETDNSSGRHEGDGDSVDMLLPEEISETEGFYEGARKQISVNTYERDRTARDKCLQHYDTRCVVCGKDMSEIYGPEAEGLIHVHHLKPLSEIKKGYQVNPIADLRPVCPNCHAVIHRRRPPYKIEEVKDLLEKARQDG